MSSLLIQICIAAGIFIAGGAAGIKWHAGQDAIKENARVAQERADERENHRIELEDSTNVIKAQNEARKRESAAVAAAAGARGELDRLRGAIALGPAQSASAPASCAVRADTLGKLLDQCSTAYQELAGTADRLDSDRRTLMQAWPK